MVTVSVLVGCRDNGPTTGDSEGASGATAAFRQALDTIIATCAEKTGSVQVRRAGYGFWEDVVVGTSFREGDWVRTGSHAFARIRFLTERGGSLDLQENSVVIIDTTIDETAEDSAGEADIVVSLEAGSVHGVIEAAAEEVAGAAEQRNRSLVVKTPDGGSARLLAEPDAGPVTFRLTRNTHGTEVAVKTGRMKLISPRGVKEIRQGQSTDVTKEGIGALVTLIGFPQSVAPGIDARYRCHDDLRIKLVWRPLKGASGYRVQVARDMSFRSIVASGDSEAVQFVFTPAGEGMYTWRVAARDRAGRSGEFGFARRIFCESEIPRDLLVSPQEDARFAFGKTSPSIAFSWQPAGNTSSYELVVVEGDSLAGSPVIQEVTSSQRLEIRGLGPGNYTWGVYALGVVKEPLFLKPRKLRIRKRKPPQAQTKGLWD